MNPRPYDFTEARDAINSAKSAQTNAEQAVRDAFREFAAARRAYQLAFAEAIIRVRAEHPATIALDLARGDPEDARRRRCRGAAGVVEGRRLARGGRVTHYLTGGTS